MNVKNFSNLRYFTININTLNYTLTVLSGQAFFYKKFLLKFIVFIALKFKLEYNFVRDCE